MTGYQPKTLQIHANIKAVLRQQNPPMNGPMTCRQVFYKMVADHAYPNTEEKYNMLLENLRQLRRDGTVPFSWIEDRTRWPRTVTMFEDRKDYIRDAVEGFRRNVWKTQPRYVECWLEKETLSPIFQEELDYYGVTFNVGHGYDSWSSPQFHISSGPLRLTLSTGAPTKPWL